MPELVEMDAEECEHLLRRSTFGRVVLVTELGPEVVPVNYTVHGDAVVIRTTPDGLLARHGDRRRVAFEVDLVDHERWLGWSVVVKGIGELVAEPPAVAPGRVRPRPWADGKRTSELHIAWTEMTGRRLGSGWDTAATVYGRRTAR